MTYEELLSDIDSDNFRKSRTLETPYLALRAVLELCRYSKVLSPDSMIPEELIRQTIEKELA
jgi:hypothetical protein